MNEQNLPLDAILQGDCVEILNALPEKSIDLIFADPPYNLQLQQELWRPNMTRVEGVDDAWDQFSDFRTYDEFSRRWLTACQRVLKDDGTIWVIGSYHNIFRVGTILQDLGFWLLNDVLWIKTNPMPNFRGVRFTNAHETLIWASKGRGRRYTFNHHAMKAMNDDLQMRSDWVLPICCGPERLKENGKKAHSTQKPEALLYRVILASSNPGDVVLDPFFGSGTTGAVARKLHRHWIGIEKDPGYIQLARQRIEQVVPGDLSDINGRVHGNPRHAVRIPFGALLESGLLQPGQTLYFGGDRTRAARVRADAHLVMQDFEGSIHAAGSFLMNSGSCNGWDHWYFEDEAGVLAPIDVLRQKLREQMAQPVDGDLSEDP